MPVMPYQILLFCVIAALAYAAWSDLATRIIPNQACIVIVAAGMTARAMAGAAPLAWSLLFSALLFCLLVAAHARGILGGGDVKLISATAIALPPAGAFLFLTATAVAGGALAAVHLLLRYLPPPAPMPAGAPLLSRLCAIERWRIRRHSPLPYGIAIASGGSWALLSTLGS
ncbi:MAG TPA: prepilin peptidase [Acetobacteraceae bacterium]|jgi:prepilin peptidase CpaA|nr:prepilin peptidase [Acetobacteraceae bacterium]